MDNVGPFDRSKPLAPGLVLEQADGTGWMALYCLSMLEIAIVLAAEDPAYEDVAIKFFEHFALIAEAINDKGLWDEADGFYYDQVRRPADGSVWPVRTRSMTGLIPLCAVAIGPGGMAQRLPEFSARVFDFLRVKPQYAGVVATSDTADEPAMVALVGHDRLPRVLERLGDEQEFLSRHGVRSVSAAYRGHPFEFWQDGHVVATIDYEPAESTTALFGGNSNWRGPIWFPVNFLVIGALDRYAARLRGRIHVRVPARVGEPADADRDHHRPVPASGRHLPARRRRPPASVRRSPRSGPELGRRAVLPRVLPRRRRPRAGRLAPDRLDRARRRHGDPAVARPRGVGAMTLPALGARVDGRRRRVRGVQRRGRVGRAVPVRRRRRRDPRCRSRPTRGSSGADGPLGRGPAPGTAFACMAPGIRPRAGAAIRPSCCSIPTPERSPAACEWHQAIQGEDSEDSAPYVPRSVVVESEFDWADDRPPSTALEDSVMYELHVKGYTALHPKVPERLRGTYRGLAQPAVIEHLQRLGVTAVELLPVHQFVHDRQLVARGLRNYWGYQSIGYFAPHNEILVGR